MGVVVVVIYGIIQNENGTFLGQSVVYKELKLCTLVMWMCMCRVQWHVVSFQRGRWSCLCVVFWKDKAMARASDGWHSTSTEFVYAAISCFCCCCLDMFGCAVQYFSLICFAICFWSLAATYNMCVNVLFLIFQYVCSAVCVSYDCIAERCLNQMDLWQFIGIWG